MSTEHNNQEVRKAGNSSASTRDILVSQNDSLSRSLITHRHVLIAAIVSLSVVCGLSLPFVPSKYQFVMIAFFPAIGMGMATLLNPFLGVCSFFFYEYMQLNYFISGIMALHLTIVIEISTFISWMIQVAERRALIRWCRFNWAFLAFVAIIATTVVTAANNKRAYDTLQVMAITFLMFLIATSIINSLQRLNVLVGILLLVHFYYGIKGIATGGFVGGALMGDENDLALAMSVFIPFAYFFFVGARSLSAKIYYLAMLIACVLAIIASMSRGGTVGLIAVIAYCIMRSRNRLVSILVVALLGIAILAFAPSKYWDDTQTILDTSEATARSRLNYWMASVRMFVDYPLTGVGAGNGGIRMPEYITGMGDPNREWSRTFHGTLPQVLGELGGLGIAAYVIMIYMAATMLLRIRKRPFQANQKTIHKYTDSIIGGMIGFLASGTFLSTAYYPQLWTMYTLAIALLYITEAQIQNESVNIDSNQLLILPSTR